jgi:hypothetical protein
MAVREYNRNVRPKLCGSIAKVCTEKRNFWDESVTTPEHDGVCVYRVIRVGDARLHGLCAEVQWHGTVEPRPERWVLHETECVVVCVVRAHHAWSLGHHHTSDHHARCPLVASIPRHTHAGCSMHAEPQRAPVCKGEPLRECTV